MASTAGEGRFWLALMLPEHGEVAQAGFQAHFWKTNKKTPLMIQIENVLSAVARMIHISYASYIISYYVLSYKVEL